MVELGEIPPQEKSPSSLPMRYAFALPNASPEMQTKIDDLNVVLSGISAFHSWSTSHEGDHPADLPRWFQKILQESESKYELLMAMRDLRFFSDESGQDRETLRQTIRQAIPTDLPPPTTITMENPEEIDVLQKKLSGIVHDVANPFSTIIGFSSMVMEAHKNNEPDFDYEDVQPKLLRSYTNIRETIENGNDILRDAYPKEPLTAAELYGELQKHFAFTITNLATTLPKDFPNIPGSVHWSPAWLKTLTDNIIQNTEKAYQAAREMGKPIDIFKLAVSFAQTEDGRSIDILFDDTGTGFPPDIVEHGFQTGKTHWEGGVTGTGTGMAFHATILKEKYGGNLIPTNRVGADGAIAGGRLIVRLPLLH